MQSIVIEKHEAIKNREIFIRNFEYIFDIPYEVLIFYEIEKQFECVYDAEYGAIESAKNSAYFEDEQGNIEEISFDEIKYAFEIGIENISDIHRIKREKGSLDQVIL